MASPITPAIAAHANTASSAKPTLLGIRNVAKNFGRTAVLRNVSLEIAEGEFLTILGESGSGKTTLLRIIAGFETASAGEVWMGRRDWISSLLTVGGSTPCFNLTHCFRTLQWKRMWRMDYALQSVL
jgi:ABC-type glutathione transport system ATPase component